MQLSCRALKLPSAEEIKPVGTQAGFLFNDSLSNTIIKATRDVADQLRAASEGWSTQVEFRKAAGMPVKSCCRDSCKKQETEKMHFIRNAASGISRGLHWSGPSSENHAKRRELKVVPVFILTAFSQIQARS